MAFRERAAEAFQTLTQRYQDLLAKARTRTMEQNYQFYRDVSSPVVAGTLLPARSIILLALAFAGGLFAAVVYALIRPVFADEAKPEPSRLPFLVANTESAQIPDLKEIRPSI